MNSSQCPSCSASNTENIYEIGNIPVHSVLLHPDRAEALNYPTGDIRLHFCHTCGFLFNAAFNQGIHEYSEKYEATQGYSPTFNVFHKRLADTLIARFDLHGKTIVEVGCGQGEFLSLLCDQGQNQGIGFDPAYVPERSMAPKADNVRFVQDFYSEEYSHIQGDFLCCKMTLEHIYQTGDFIQMIRRSMEQDTGRVVFFQIPNARYVLQEAAFWDIYYEHCSYFSAGSLAKLFHSAGFQVLDLWTDYDDQYLMIAAGLLADRPPAQLKLEEDISELREEVSRFKSKVQQKKESWSRKLAALRDEDKRVVLWGGGSKAVSFLTTLGISCQELPFAVDINPHKHGTFLAGSGQEVIAPARLASYRPDLVIVMNPVYTSEIRQTLAEMGLHPELLSISSY
jgi:2-polyprenyl-3-methyl-5-hydroxy-6-metoxy-1,4-benzoquinol methylase